jgi:hypothetical protein
MKVAFIINNLSIIIRETASRMLAYGVNWIARNSNESTAFGFLRRELRAVLFITAAARKVFEPIGNATRRRSRVANRACGADHRVAMVFGQTIGKSGEDA